MKGTQRIQVGDRVLLVEQVNSHKWEAWYDCLWQSVDAIESWKPKRRAGLIGLDGFRLKNPSERVSPNLRKKTKLDMNDPIK